MFPVRVEGVEHGTCCRGCQAVAQTIADDALAQRLDPEFASLVKELVIMGGSLAPRQVLEGKSASDFAREFVNTPRREFNIRFDPEAASMAAPASAASGSRSSPASNCLTLAVVAAVVRRTVAGLA